jgi:predicted dienelactone hydrolase
MWEALCCRGAQGLFEAPQSQAEFTFAVAPWPGNYGDFRALEAILARQTRAAEFPTDLWGNQSAEPVDRRHQRQQVNGPNGPCTEACCAIQLQQCADKLVAFSTN